MVANDNLAAAIKLRDEELFPQLGTQLRPLMETVRICPGVGENDCGDEIDADADPKQELCPSCQREEDDHYHRLMLEKEKREEENSKSQYLHLRYEDSGEQSGEGDTAE